MRHHDVVVVGGSLAGAACVRELERLGMDAVAFERDRFPRAKVCGGFVSPGGVACLEQLGVLDKVRKAGATEVNSARIRVDSLEVELPFKCPGLGISRSALDEIVARGASVDQGAAVTNVVRRANGFIVSGSGFEVACRIVIDASGKLGRFTRRWPVGEFGIQFFDAGTRQGFLDFWFFEDGYGGGVSVEGGRSNYCFLINKDRLRRYVSRPGCMVTGPLAYERLPGEFIAIGDAAGMVDPFCGEGMRHALDSGMVAAGIVGRGLRAGWTYEEIRREYEFEWSRRWSRKRVMGAVVRRMLRNRRLLSRALRLNPAQFLNWMWE
jgi:flavin-dependent dehydrogenase